MLKNVEFYLSLDKENIMVENIETNSISHLKEISFGDIKAIDIEIKKNYTETYNCLCAKFGDQYHSAFARVYQFIACNLGSRDGIVDIDEDGNFHLEKTSCPIRHRCKDNFCTPKITSDLSKRELEVIDLFVKGMCKEEIGERLFISANTVHNHINNIYQKLDFVGKSHPDRLLMVYGLKRNNN